MCFVAVNWASKQQCENASQKLILMMLAVHRNSDTGRCNPSQKLLAAECCMSLRNVVKQLQSLMDLGLIKIVQIKENNNHLPNQYELKIAVDKPTKTPTNNSKLSNMSSDEQILSKTNTTTTGPENDFIAPLESSHANSAQGVMHTIHEGHAAIAQGVTHNFHERHAEPAYEYINKYSFSPSLTEDEKNCFMWARDNPFWGKLITSEEKFLELYGNKNPMGLKTQYMNDIKKHREYSGNSNAEHKKFTGKDRRQYTPAERVARAAGFQID